MKNWDSGMGRLVLWSWENHTSFLRPMPVQGANTNLLFSPREEGSLIPAACRMGRASPLSCKTQLSSCLKLDILHFLRMLFLCTHAWATLLEWEAGNGPGGHDAHLPPCDDIGLGLRTGGGGLEKQDGVPGFQGEAF